MNMTVTNIILVLTATTTALIAGLFYSYSCSVVLGLGRLPDAEYIGAMQSINRAVLNPVFFSSFFGTLVLLPLSTYLSYPHPLPVQFWLLLTATIIYLAGVFGVTVAGNIPLNNALDNFDLLNASKEVIAAQRTIFERPWNNLNIIRTIASMLSIVLVIIACINNGKSILTIND